MCDVGSRQTMTDIDTKRATTKCIATTLAGPSRGEGKSFPGPTLIKKHHSILW